MKPARRGDTEEDDKTARNLQCFLNQPNINMVIPWIYEIQKTMASSRDSSGGGDGEQDEEDKTAKDLECFLNQPNINMVIPWVYQIYKSVKSGGGGSGGGSEVIVKEMEWEVEGDD